MLVNTEYFKVKESEIPKLPPQLSYESAEWWREQKRRCIEGYWVGGKFMPGRFYFYINFWTIQLNDRLNPKKRIFARPELWDIHWEISEGLMIARGFIGYEKDPNVQKAIELYRTGDIEKFRDYLKTLKDPLEIFNTPYGKNLGKPIYLNDSKDFMLMGSRSGGKSWYITGSEIGHSFLFDNATEYPADATESSVSIVGAYDTKYSGELLKKTKIGLDNLPGSITINGLYYPSPFMKQYIGTFGEKTGKISAEFQVKESGNWITKGTRSSILHVSYKDNPFAAAGMSAHNMYFEECGLFDNLIETREATTDVVTRAGIRYGTRVFMGCVCAGTKVWVNNGRLVNIEDLQLEDGIIGYDGNGYIKQSIAYLNPPQKKECYRITLTGGTSIECSYDHPFLTYIRKEKSSNTKNVRFVKAEDLKVGYNVATLSEIPIFGNVYDKNAYLVGLSLGYNDLNKKFRESGILGQTKLSKRLPSNIHKFDKKSLANLLAGYFDADGNVCIPIKNKKGRIVLTSIYVDLLEDVKYQLYKFGIHSTVIKELRKSIPSEEYKGQLPFIYRLYINKREDIEKFVENIPLKIQYKINNLKKILEVPTNKRFGKIEGAKFIYNEVDKKGEYFKDSPINNLRHLRVEKVEYIGEKDVYNLNCSPTHTYVVNNLVSANTGGEMSAGTIPASMMFTDPLNYDLVAYDDVYEHKGKIGYFIPANKALMFFKDKDGNTLEEKSKKEIERIREDLRKNSKTSSALESEKQNKPMFPSEMFISKSGNIFPIYELQKLLGILETNDDILNAADVGEFGLDEDGNVFFQDLPKYRYITKFPHNPSKDDIRGAWIIWEHPEKDAAGKPISGLYILGTDPYDHDQSGTMSLGSTFVYKKIYTTGKTMNILVAEYTGRNEKGSNAYYEQVRRGLIYYSGRLMFENINIGMYKYFEQKNSTHTMMDVPEYTKEAGSQPNRPKGMHFGKSQIVHGELLIKEYLEEEIQPGLLQLYTIKSPALVKELIMYNQKDNYDRVRAFMCCLYGDQETSKIKIKEAIRKSEDNWFTRTWRDKNNNNLNKYNEKTNTFTEKALFNQIKF